MKEKNLNLNLIRLFAAWMVLSVHITQRTGMDFSVGAYGVQLFFILSGYLAFYSFTNNNYSTIEYYKNRAVRILPTYWFCLILLYFQDVFWGIFYNKLSIQEVFTGQCSPRFLRYFFGLQCFIPSDNWDLWNNHNALWTMSSFIAFYIFTPFLYKILNNFYTSFACTICFLVGRPFFIKTIQLWFSDYPADAHIEWFSLNNPLSELYCYLLGCTLYLAIKKEKQNIYIFIITIILIVTRFEWYQFEFIFVLLIYISISMAPLTHNKILNKFISIASNGSFALYLIHPIVLIVASAIWQSCGIFNKWFYALYLYISCIGVSYCIYYFGIIRIERYIKRKVYN